ncbi:hypothetical protein KGM_201005 [Danaus plexippus plexippus]|uniref:Uncharacterized protein n=1 Tax=Danaus plexippus plexippus TaxID=278856 RepID=A0A212EK12_DANPL|nr:hypothetical protein KGM_201005 [Danaus plexippus plexippus]
MADTSPATSIIEGTVKFRDGKKQNIQRAYVLYQLLMHLMTVNYSRSKLRESDLYVHVTSNIMAYQCDNILRIGNIDIQKYVADKIMDTFTAAHLNMTLTVKSIHELNAIWILLPYARPPRVLEAAAVNTCQGTGLKRLSSAFIEDVTLTS